MWEPACPSWFSRCLVLLLITAHTASASARGELRPCDSKSPPASLDEWSKQT
uniref:Uncharacterized protein n=1 Tax=Nothobranchius furzeri TaxID=105023 RepID=A0A1A8VJJ6_NOTFU